MIFNNIQNNTNKYYPPKPREEKDDDRCALSEAIDAFRTTMLTGRRTLSADEKAEIKGRIGYYLSWHEINTLDEIDAFEVFLRGLALEFGDRSDFVEFLQELVYEMTELEMEFYDVYVHAPRGQDINIKSSAETEEEDEEAIVSFMRAKLGSNPVLQQQLGHFQLTR